MKATERIELLWRVLRDKPIKVDQGHYWTGTSSYLSPEMGCRRCNVALRHAKKYGCLVAVGRAIPMRESGNG